MIVDVKLGLGSGIAAVEAVIRGEPEPIPHVYIGGDFSEVLASRPGAVAIRKPFREPDLVLAMRRTLKARTAQRWR